ncbi:MAG: HNH endonuclease [Bacilli bacterium]|nr:HNH endonuclease [Bacilli bacterium]
MIDTLTQNNLKEIILYEPLTGLFYWKVWKSGRRMHIPIGTKTGSGYLVTTINYKQYSLHRLAFLYMEGAFPPEQVDHIDNNKLNNCWDNLRHANMYQNAQNKPIGLSNTSGVKGVCWDKHNNRWKASIDYNGKVKHVGLFKDKKDAIDAIIEFRNKKHLEFANYN